MQGPLHRCQLSWIHRGEICPHPTLRALLSEKRRLHQDRMGPQARSREGRCRRGPSAVDTVDGLLSIQYTPSQQKTHFIQLLIHVLCFSAPVSSSCALGEVTLSTVSKMGWVSPKEIVSPASDCYMRGTRPLGQWNTRHRFLAAPSLFWGNFLELHRTIRLAGNHMWLLSTCGESK